MYSIIKIHSDISGITPLFQGRIISFAPYSLLMEETQEPSRSIKTVDRAFTIIDTLDELGGAKLTDLARELDMPTSTAHTYLQTLVETGYVARLLPV